VFYFIFSINNKNLKIRALNFLPAFSQIAGVNKAGNIDLYVSGNTGSVCNSRSCEKIWKTYGTNSVREGGEWSSSFVSNIRKKLKSIMFSTYQPHLLVESSGTDQITYFQSLLKLPDYSDN
jgi:hypothetical protein